MSTGKKVCMLLAVPVITSMTFLGSSSAQAATAQSVSTASSSVERTTRTVVLKDSKGKVRKTKQSSVGRTNFSRISTAGQARLIVTTEQRNGKRILARYDKVVVSESEYYPVPPVKPVGATAPGAITEIAEVSCKKPVLSKTGKSVSMRCTATLTKDGEEIPLGTSSVTRAVPNP